MSNILLSAQEVRELKHLCSDPLLELGMTLRPKHLACFERKVAIHHMCNGATKIRKKSRFQGNTSPPVMKL